MILLKLYFLENSLIYERHAQQIFFLTGNGNWSREDVRVYFICSLISSFNLHAEPLVKLGTINCLFWPSVPHARQTSTLPLVFVCCVVSLVLKSRRSHLGLNDDARRNRAPCLQIYTSDFIFTAVRWWEMVHKYISLISYRIYSLTAWKVLTTWRIFIYAISTNIHKMQNCFSGLSKHWDQEF